MTAVEHMIAWIESSRPHYERLLQLERNRKAALDADTSFHALLAQNALAIVVSAYYEAVRSGDMNGDQWSPALVLDAAKAALEWELEQ